MWLGVPFLGTFVSLLLFVTGLPAGFLFATICNSVARGELLPPDPAMALFEAVPVAAVLVWSPLWLMRVRATTGAYAAGALRRGARRWPHAVELGLLLFAAGLFVLGFGAVMSWPD